MSGEDQDICTRQDAAVTPEGRVRPEGMADQEYQVAIKEARAALYAEVLRLPETWAAVVILHLGLGDQRPHTFEEIGAAMGVHRQVPHRTFHKAMDRLRRPAAIARLKRAGVPQIFEVRT